MEGFVERERELAWDGMHGGFQNVFVTYGTGFENDFVTFGRAFITMGPPHAQV